MSITADPARVHGATHVRVEPTDATPLPRASSAGSRLATSQVLFVLVALVGWLFAYLYLFSGFSAGHAQQRLYQQLREELALGTAPIAAPIALGEPVALLDAEGLGLHHVVVVEGTRPAQLQDGPGHALGSVLPGQAGTSVLMGRSVSFGAPFRKAPEVARGETLTVTTGSGTFRYRVDGVRRKGDPAPPAPGAGAGRLVLVTAAGSGSGAFLAPSDSVYVDASLVGTAQPAGALAAPDPAGGVFARDTSAGTVALVALALELLVGAVVAMAWARHRWSPVASWIAGVPVLLAALWLVSGVATRLLPNLV
jgi:sortase A